VSAAAHPQLEERAWLVRAVLVLQSPRVVFAALRDDSDEGARARQEAVAALVGLCGIAGVLWTPVAGRLLDDPAIDGLLVAVWAFIGGVFYGLVIYFAGGGLLYLGLRSAGSIGSYRRARHLLAFSAAPVALSLLIVWPLRLAVFGEEVFRTGGSDSGALGGAFDTAMGAFVLWSLALLVVGTCTVHGWRLARALEGVGIGVVLSALLVFSGRLLGLE
jgi:hypothetical protein